MLSLGAIISGGNSSSSSSSRFVDGGAVANTHGRYGMTDLPLSTVSHTIVNHAASSGRLKTMISGT